MGDNGYAVLDRSTAASPSAGNPDRPRLDRPVRASATPSAGSGSLKGARRPSLKAFLEQTDVTWTSAAVAWYDGATRTVEFTSQTAVWYRGKPPVLIRWVLIRDPQGAFDPQALRTEDPAQILQWFVLLATGGLEVRTHLWRPSASPGSPHHARPAGALFMQRPRLQKGRPISQRAAWYVADLGLWRRHLWLASEGFSLSAADPDTQELPITLYHRLIDSLLMPLEMRKVQARVRAARSRSAAAARAPGSSGMLRSSVWNRLTAVRRASAACNGGFSTSVCTWATVMLSRAPTTRHRLNPRRIGTRSLLDGPGVSPSGSGA